MGSFLAAAKGQIYWAVSLLIFLTAILLQILSNLANDYGDSIHGADREGRAGPARAVQSGAISASEMRLAIMIVAGLTAITGLLLVLLVFGLSSLLWATIFLLLGAAAIWAAISYTAGTMPYGYAGLGDLAVFLFFGWIGVAGSYLLLTQVIDLAILLPATSVGLFAVAVLNVNNVRDIDSDRAAGKNSVPVRLGLRGSRIYHWVLLINGFMAALIFILMAYISPWQFLFIFTLPLFIQNGLAVSRLEGSELDPFLRQMSLATLAFVLTFGIGLLI
jgi:1,4-dihydroxy-2-naphthoate octaprenyltransferase